jgi:D-alanine-D-alanine ligase
LGVPLFVKPANLGSSVGISKVRNKNQFFAAVRDAFLYDSKIIIEENIRGREIECSVLGNESPIASLPGEIITRHDFYSYDAKYIDEKGARLVIPADLPAAVARKTQELAIRTFQVLCCQGMARVDFFLRGDRDVIVNEINTIPGFTKISMYPKLWEASGIPYAELIDRLIQLAIERFRSETRLRTSK